MSCSPPVCPWGPHISPAPCGKGRGAPPSAHPLHLQRIRAGIIMIMSTPNTDSLLSGSQSAFPSRLSLSLPHPHYCPWRTDPVCSKENPRPEVDGTHLSTQPAQLTEQSRAAVSRAMPVLTPGALACWILPVSHQEPLTRPANPSLPPGEAQAPGSGS